MGVGSRTKQAAGLIGFWDQRVANSVGTVKRRTLEVFFAYSMGAVQVSSSDQKR